MVIKMRGKARNDERGDTLIEVTFALSILAFVLLGATGVASGAFRAGQTAKERTQVSDVAQQQMEALRSFRDNHSWGEFSSGQAGFYLGVDTASLSSTCNFDPTKKCFHMELKPTVAATTEWVPIAGSISAPVPGVPTIPAQGAILEIWADNTATDMVARPCEYDFELHYSIPIASGTIPAQNHIRTRLTNLRYTPPFAGPTVCL